MEFLTVGANIGDTNFQIGTKLRNGEICDSEIHPASLFRSSEAEDVLSHVLLGYMVRHGIARQVRAVDIHLSETDTAMGFSHLEKPVLERELSEKLGLHVSVQTHTAEG